MTRTYHQSGGHWRLQRVSNLHGILTNTASPRAYCPDCLTQALLPSMSSSGVRRTICPPVGATVPPWLPATTTGVWGRGRCKRGVVVQGRIVRRAGEVRWECRKLKQLAVGRAIAGYGGRLHLHALSGMERDTVFRRARCIATLTFLKVLKVLQAICAVPGQQSLIRRDEQKDT